MSLFKRVIAVVALALPMLAGAEEVGQVSTVFKFLGPNDRIVVPPPETPRFTPEPAQPRNNPGNWVTEADYSSRAMRLGMEGVTRFTLTIGADGRVSDCQVTGSSGHAELDTAACQLIAKRARFEPARNDKGDKIAGSYSSAVRWTIRN